ncbi:MAG: hypothetical protein ACXVNM_08645 [Bacteroidia bacterium]
MKKITLGCSLLAAVAMLFSSCNKKSNVAPEQDMEFESTKNVTYGNDLITELDIIVSYAGENLTSTGFFTPAPGTGTTSPTYSITLSRDTTNKLLSVTYTGSVTCRDGKKRNGQILIDYSGSNATYGAKFYRDPGFVAKVSLNNYWVDGWFVDDAAPFTIKNNVPFGYTLGSTNLNWTIDGYFSILPQVPADSVNKIVWKGTLLKTLTNTSPSVLTSKNAPINWALYNAAGTPTVAAKVAYTGTVTGVTSRVISYTYVVDGAKPEQALVRDFACSVDRINAVTITSTLVTTTPSQWHPFISGIATFTSNGEGTTYPRVIDYASGETSAPCDNSGTVMIKGITYPIDFKK